jgi:hypothetical protein
VKDERDVLGPTSQEMPSMVVLVAADSFKRRNYFRGLSGGFDQMCLFSSSLFRDSHLPLKEPGSNGENTLRLKKHHLLQLSSL